MPSRRRAKSFPTKKKCEHRGARLSDYSGKIVEIGLVVDSRPCVLNRLPDSEEARVSPSGEVGTLELPPRLTPRSISLLPNSSMKPGAFSKPATFFFALSTGRVIAKRAMHRLIPGSLRVSVP